MKPVPPTPVSEALEKLVYRHPALPPSFEEVVLLVDKPQGWSSFAVVKKVRYLVRQATGNAVKKVGHAGTLDPMATGLLICLIGKATKQMEAFMGLPKVYTGTIRLGEETPSYDAETEVTVRKPWSHIGLKDVEAVLPEFTGAIAQRPPLYSAIKVDGERLYKKARRGEDSDIPIRTVQVYDFDLTGMEGSDVTFRVHCSKGTYIRSLAHDLGQKLGTGAHLVALRRVAIGPYPVAEAWTIPQLEEAFHEQ